MLAVALGLFELRAQRLLLFARTGARLLHRHLLSQVGRVELCLQLRDLRLFLRDRLLQFARGLGLGEFDRFALVFFDELFAVLEFALELRVAHLLHNIRISRFVDGERLPAMRTCDVVLHGPLLCTLGRAAGSVQYRAAPRADSRMWPSRGPLRISCLRRACRSWHSCRAVRCRRPLGTRSHAPCRS